MRLVLVFLLAAAAPRFDVTDARGKKPGGITVELGDPAEDGWFHLRVQAKGKGSPLLIWPLAGLAKSADGPGEIPVIVIESGDVKALVNPRVLASIAAGEMLGFPPATGIDAGELAKALVSFPETDDPFAKGVALLYAKKPAQAVEPLGRALKERERRLTRVPSEIYPAAMLYGRALAETQKFDEAAVAFLKALKQRPSDPLAARLRADALVRAGKPEAR